MKSKFKIKGTVRIYHDSELVLEKFNSIQPVSMDIIRRAISGYSGAVINKIAVYHDSTILKTIPLSEEPELLDSVNNNEVKFIAKFTPDSFTGTFNKLKLLSGVGVFSELTGFENTKTTFHSLKVEWVLEIIIITQ